MNSPSRRIYIFELAKPGYREAQALAKNLDAIGIDTSTLTACRSCQPVHLPDWSQVDEAQAFIRWSCYAVREQQFVDGKQLVQLKQALVPWRNAVAVRSTRARKFLASYLR